MVGLLSSSRPSVLGVATGILFWFSAQVWAVPPILSDSLITDVSDRSFSLIWTTDQPGTASVEVYTDAAGTQPATGIITTRYPLNTGDPSLNGLQRETSRQDIVQAARDMGIVKVRIHGLSADTSYYLKFGVENAALESTLCPDAGAIYCPDQSTTMPMLQTSRELKRTFQNPGEQVFQNDVLIQGDIEITAGEIIIVNSEHSRYPVSVFAGDGASLPYCLVDLNNLFQQGESLRIQSATESDMGIHAEGLVVRRYRGQLGNQTHVERINIVSGTGQPVNSVAVAYGDCNADTRIDGYDLLQVEHYLDGRFSNSDFHEVAFHSIFCNLFAEQGRHKVDSTVTIDQLDADRLEGLLIGTVDPVSLPEQP